MGQPGDNRRFVFVNLSLDSGYYGVNHGIACLVPIVRRNSFRVSVLHIADDISTEEFRERIRTLAPTVIGFSCTSLQKKHLERFSTAVQDLPDVLKIAGGVGPTLEPELILQGAALDGVVVGEGEWPIESLLRAINSGGDIYETKGFCWKKGGRIQRNEIPPFVSELEKLPHPDYSVFDRNVVQSRGSVNVMLSRGCPYSCTYCCNEAIRSVYSSHAGYFRIPPVECGVQLLKDLIQAYPGTRYINFEDDLLIAKKRWFLSFAEEYRRQIGLPYRMCVRAECLDDEIVKALKKSGCTLAFMGVESGSEAVRTRLLNRHHGNSHLLEKSRLVKQAGIKLFTFNIVGFPHEEPDQMRETLELNKEMEPDCGVCTFFYPLPGTGLFELCRKENLLKAPQELAALTNYNTGPAIKLTNDQEREALRIQRDLQRYLVWREFKYELAALGKASSGLSWLTGVVRLWGAYVLRRFASRRLQRRILENRARIWLWRKLFGRG